MKIITGTLRGRTISAIDGLATRPTTGRIKESIFNIIQFDIEGRKVLDLFAGSGQMGLEALSRGAAHCVFCETDRRAFEILRQNIENCKVSNAAAHNRDGIVFLKGAGKASFGLIFIDPPYDSDLLKKALNAIFEFDILQDGGIIVCESDKGMELADVSAPYGKLKEYIYGKTKITTITKGA